MNSRPLTILELFILALVKSGIQTGYELQTKANVSLGSSLPALQKLRTAKLLIATKGASRGAVIYSITSAGQSELESQWKSLLEEQPKDLDSILRIATVARLMESPQDAIEFLKTSVERLKRQARVLRKKSKSSLKKQSGETIDLNNCWLREYVKAAQLNAAADGILRLIRLIP
jgi:DNA-binding PadR family transcriptional regulator